MSNCDKIRQEINLYLDNEVSLDKKQLIEEHLKSCPACQNLFGQERRLEQKLVEFISQSSPDDEAIWNKGIALLKTQNREFIPHKINILKYLIPATAAAFIIIIFGALFVLLPNSASDLLAEVEKEHQSILNPEFQPAFKTGSPEELVKHFEEQCNFNISECKCLMEKKGYCCKGGKMCSLKERPAVHMLTYYQNIPISTFVLSEKELDAFPKAQLHLTRCHEIYQTKFKDFNCAMIRLHKNIVCAMGAVNPEILKQLLNDTNIPIKRCSKCND